MVHFGRTALVVQTWLTGAMMLVAGLPRSECHCPDGHVIPFCLGIGSRAGGCCCGRGCCSGGGGCCQAGEQAPAHRAPEACCCCQHHARSTTPRLPAGGTAVGHGSCVKTPAAANFLAVAAKETAAGDNVFLGTLLPCHDARVCPPPAGVNRQASSQAHALAPPTDLVTVLRRLLI